MSDMTDPDVVSAVTRVCQIIVAALIAGVTVFLLMVLFVVPPLGNPAAPAAGGVRGIAGLPLITALALAVGAAGLAMSFVIPRLMVVNMRRMIAKGAFPAAKPGKGPAEPAQAYMAGDTGRLLQVYQTQLIVASALCEGMAFFAAIAYMLERRPAALAAALVFLAGIVVRFPTANRVNAWLDEQLGLLQWDRQAAL